MQLGDDSDEFTSNEPPRARYQLALSTIQARLALILLTDLTSVYILASKSATFRFFCFHLNFNHCLSLNMMFCPLVVLSLRDSVK